MIATIGTYLFFIGGGAILLGLFVYLVLLTISLVKEGAWWAGITTVGFFLFLIGAGILEFGQR